MLIIIVNQGTLVEGVARLVRYIDAPTARQMCLRSGGTLPTSSDAHPTLGGARPRPRLRWPPGRPAPRPDGVCPRTGRPSPQTGRRSPYTRRGSPPARSPLFPDTPSASRTSVSPSAPPNRPGSASAPARKRHRWPIDVARAASMGHRCRLRRPPRRCDCRQRPVRRCASVKIAPHLSHESHPYQFCGPASQTVVPILACRGRSALPGPSLPLGRSLVCRGDLACQADPGPRPPGRTPRPPVRPPAHRAEPPTHPADPRLSPKPGARRAEPSPRPRRVRTRDLR
jgi:hypothetical protein